MPTNTAISFPLSPTNNSTYTYAGTTYVYTTTLGWSLYLGSTSLPAYVLEANIATSAVTTAKIANDAVTTAKILDSNITASKIATGIIVNSHISSIAAIDGSKITPLFTSAATFSSTDYLKIPVGTSVERPVSLVDGQIRLNSSLGRPEWYSSYHSEWKPFSFNFNVKTSKAIFGFGNYYISETNLVSNTGVVSADTTGVGTARRDLAAAGYGTDKAIFGYGSSSGASNVSTTNLVSNTGVVATNTAGVGTTRYGLAAASYDSDKAVFGFGYSSAYVSMTNLVSNTGVVAADTTGVGTARAYLAAAGYGVGNAIFGFGSTGSVTNYISLISNTGAYVSETSGVGTARSGLAAAGYST